MDTSTSTSTSTSPSHHNATEQQPVLLLLKGHPGSGKSTLARALAQSLRWPLVDKDDARDALQAINSQVTQASIDLNTLSYDIMFRTAATQLSLGLSTIMDCPLARVELYQRAAALAQLHRANIALVDCQPSDVLVWRQRLEGRAAAGAAMHTGHKPQTWQQLQQLIARYDGCCTWNQAGTVNVPHQISVDTAVGSAAESAAVVISWLESSGLVPPHNCI